MTLLSFFAHTTPVALIRFGEPVLLEAGIEIRSVEQIGSMKNELDNTIAVLIRYGLVERTLLEYYMTLPHRTSPGEARPRRAGTLDSDHCESRLLQDDSSSFRGLNKARPDNGSDETSSQSVTYSIDILRIHTVVQSVLRDELKLRYADQPAHYWWWLTVASKMLCHSYTVADGKIKSTEGRGLVRDYRDYETQAARLRSHFPKSLADASPSLRKTRHNLHEIIRTIRQEIKNCSPSQSRDSLNHPVQYSVFERANSTSSDSPGTNDTDLTRTSTWTPEHPDDQIESPIQMQVGPHFDDGGSEGSWTDRWSQSGMDNSRVLVPSTNLSRQQSDSDVYTVTPTEAGFNTVRRSSVLNAIFQGGTSQSKKPKNLGEWKPLPVPPTLSEAQAQIRSRASSLTNGSDERTTRPPSTGSEASGVLAAIHRASPPPVRGGRIKSPTRAPGLRPLSDGQRPPLSAKCQNQTTSLLATAFQSGQHQPTEDVSELRKHSRHPSSSPRLIQTALSNQAANKVTTPCDEGSLPSGPLDMYYKSSPVHGLGVGRSSRPPPSGYTSQPMSRDTSRESNASHATAPPAVPGSASLGTSPQIREPYLYSRPGLASMDVVTANSGDEALAGVGAQASNSLHVSSDGDGIFERDHENLGAPSYSSAN